MKKTLIMILIILLLITIGLILLNSLHLGGLNILGIRELNEKNKKIDNNIQKLANLSNSAYQKAFNNVSESAKEYEEAKKNYDELVEVSTSNEVVTANQLQKYEIEYLWAKIGKHATDEDVTLKIQITENGTSATTGYYDLNFTAEGDYVGITDFIYDIENDSSLGFKIEKFKMQPLETSNQNSSSNNDDQSSSKSTAGKISATFTCTNVAVNIDSSLIVKPENKEQTNNDSVENSNNTEGNNTTSSNSWLNP